MNKYFSAAIGLVAVIVAVLLIHPAGAQTPDTLDARGYFPLAMGNEWEYHHHEDRPMGPRRAQDESFTFYVQHRITSDGLGPSGDTFEMVTKTFSEESVLESSVTKHVRFDESTGSVVTRHTRVDGTEVEVQYPDFACNLSAPYGINTDGVDCWIQVDSTEVSDLPLFEGRESVNGKMFIDYISNAVAVHGVGFVIGGWAPDGCSYWCDSGRWSLTYAQVDGAQFGARAVTSDRQLEAQSSELALYPNPSVGRVTVHPGDGPTGDIRIEVFDALGREVWSTPPFSRSPSQLELGHLPAGLYVVRVGTQSSRLILR